MFIFPIVLLNVHNLPLSLICPEVIGRVRELPLGGWCSTNRKEFSLFVYLFISIEGVISTLIQLNKQKSYSNE